MDKTVGAWWDVLTKTVNPWKLEDLHAEQTADIARASGVGVGGKTVQASGEVVAQRQAAATAEVDAHLKAQGQHPDQADWDAGLAKLRSGIILVLAVGLGAYFLFELGKAYLSRR
jgi:hypothetical protein